MMDAEMMDMELQENAEHTAEKKKKVDMEGLIEKGKKGKLCLPFE